MVQKELVRNLVQIFGDKWFVPRAVMHRSSYKNANEIRSEWCNQLFTRNFSKCGCSTQAIYFYVLNCTVFLLVSEQDNELKIKFSNSCTNIVSELICDGNRTEWSPIRSVITQVISKQDSHLVGVQFFHHKYNNCDNNS